MSASLVGSEMCIRDRFMGRNLGSHGRALVQNDTVGVKSRWQGCVGGVAVSYTHLTLPTICSV
eukprot:10852973-Alexandrium_andersonii.AAC.1